MSVTDLCDECDRFVWCHVWKVWQIYKCQSVTFAELCCTWHSLCLLLWQAVLLWSGVNHTEAFCGVSVTMATWQQRLELLVKGVADSLRDGDQAQTLLLSVSVNSSMTVFETTQQIGRVQVRVCVCVCVYQCLSLCARACVRLCFDVIFVRFHVKNGYPWDRLQKPKTHVETPMPICLTLYLVVMWLQDRNRWWTECYNSILHVIVRICRD